MGNDEKLWWKHYKCFIFLIFRPDAYEKEPKPQLYVAMFVSMYKLTVHLALDPFICSDASQVL